MGDRWYRRYETIDDAIRDENWEAVDFLFRSGVKIENVCHVAWCIGRHRRYVQNLLDRGHTPYNWISYGAIVGGHIDIVKQMVGLGVKAYSTGARMAAKHGHMHIVQYMLSIGSRDYEGIARTAEQHGHHGIAAYVRGFE